MKVPFELAALSLVTFFVQAKKVTKGKNILFYQSPI
jgi:hypothetical protein